MNDKDDIIENVVNKYINEVNKGNMILYNPGDIVDMLNDLKDELSKQLNTKDYE